MRFPALKGNYIRERELSWRGCLLFGEHSLAACAPRRRAAPCEHSLRVQRSTFQRMIFTNARLIFPEGVRDGLELVVHEGKIAEIREQAQARGEDVVDVHGNYLAPGFIDLHVHGALGRDTMEASAEGFRTICDFHASGGTTSLLLTTAAAPMDKLVEVLRAIRDCSSSVSAITGVHVEGPFISRAKRGAQREEFICEPTPDSVARLLEFADVVKRVTLAPEIPNALYLIDKLRARGISVSGGHSDAWIEDARAAFEHGMRSVTHTFNCMSSSRKRGPYRVAGLLEYALSEPEISCELIADGHHVSRTLMKMLYRAKGPAGICLVTDATAGAGLAEGSGFSLYGAQCVVIAGVGMLTDQLVMAGSISRMIDLVETMVRDVDLPLHEVITMATENPARAVGLETKGCLAVSADADFAVLSRDLRVLRTFTGGREIWSE
jgi:N-acetylglucosamine-6-phosphate deacetylase